MHGQVRGDARGPLGVLAMKRYVLPFVCILILAAPGESETDAPVVMPALDSVQEGLWVLKSRDSPASNRSICLKDVRALIQLEHGAAVCNRFVISNGPRETTVHYTCPGNGYGRTTIRVETPRLLQIDTQGIHAKEPFAATIEARRIGECAPVARMIRR
jgi:hypothetical protein